MLTGWCGCFSSILSWHFSNSSENHQVLNGTIMSQRSHFHFFPFGCQKSVSIDKAPSYLCIYASVQCLPAEQLIASVWISDLVRVSEKGVGGLSPQGASPWVGQFLCREKARVGGLALSFPPASQILSSVTHSRMAGMRECPKHGSTHQMAGTWAQMLSVCGCRREPGA